MELLATTPAMFFGGKFLNGFFIGALRSVTISYIGEFLSGIMFIAGHSTYYMQRAGFSTAMSFKLQIVQQVLSTIGNISSWYLVDRAGRRNLTFWGLMTITVILLVAGGLAVKADATHQRDVTTGFVSFILIYCFFCNATIGATAYNILAEVSTSRLRTKTVAIGQSLQNLLNMTCSFVLPYLFNPDQENLGAKISFIFGGLAAASLVHLWFYQPETAGCTYEELDEMFLKGVPAREFKAYQPEVKLRGETVKVAMHENSR